MALRVEQILVGGFDQNFSYIVYCDVTKQTFVVDPSGAFELVLQVIADLQVEVVAILLTHTHQDHMDALAVAQEQFLVPVFVHEQGVAAVPAQSMEPLIDGNELELGQEKITVVHTPGHSPDAICLFFTSADNQPILIAGDTLFIDGCGRTNEAEVSALYNSIQFIKSLPPETLILPGHNYGPVAADTLSSQLLTNRFLQASSFADFCVERLGYTVNT